MRNPGENCESRVESETTSEACAKDSERDACSSPPCKRLKQAVLPFLASPSPLSTSPSSPKALVSPQNNNTSSCNFEGKPFQTCQEKPKINGGLVTGAPSPPDVKDISQKPQATPNSANASKSLMLENGVETTKEQKTCTVSSPEASSSSHEEDELMIIDHSPTGTDNKNEVNNGTPLPKSAEKQKRKEEREKERQEKQRLREEKQKEKQEAKIVKEKERLEAKRKREQERQEKQVEKERKEKERTEKREKEEKERLEKKEKRDEEKRKRDEEKNAKMEEKRKREAEKRSIEEEQERKRQKTKETFLGFFNKVKPSTNAAKVVAENSSRFKPFEIKEGMSIAPATRKQLTHDTKKALDEGLQQQEFSKLYLKELTTREPIPKLTKSKLPTIAEGTESSAEVTMLDEAITIDENSNSSVEIIEPKIESTLKVGLKYKLLQFHENYRPAYYGTWRKKSRKISARNPLKKDMELLDYEVDSDDEWEEEEPGESLSNSEGEDEAEGDNNNDEEDDDGFFVPHGYLSDDEGVEEEEDMEDGACGDGNVKDQTSRKDQQLAKAKAWEAEMKRKCKPMKPVTVGCLWLENASLNFILKRFEACLLVDGPIDVQSSTTSSKNNEIPTVDSPSSSNNGALYVPDEAMPELIKLIHGKTAGLQKIMSTFRKQWTSKCLGRDVADEEVDEKCPISKRQLERKIQNIATKERRTDRLRWFVHSHVLEKFGLDSLVVVDGFNSSDTPVDAPMAAVPQQTNTLSIMQFVKPVSPALQRTTSPELIHQTPKLKQTSSPVLNSSSPMEVDSKSPSLDAKHHQPAAQGNSQLHVGSHILGTTKTIHIGNPTLINEAANTTSISSQESFPNIETVCID